MKINKFKFHIASIVLLMSSNLIFAQLKVVTNGNVGIGTFSPLSRLHVLGDAAIFTSGAGTITSASFIRCTNSYSTAALPDYTWYNNDATGIFHPAANNIGLSIGGVEKARLVSNAIYFPNNGGQTINSAAFIRLTNAFSTAAAPDYTWYSNDVTGIFHPAANNIGFSIGGVEKARLVSSAIYFPNDGSQTINSSAFIKLTNAYSTASAPDYTWYGNNATGIFHPSADNIGFSIASSEKVRISNGTYKLIVYGDAQASGGIWQASDRRFKKNIKSIDGALDKILKLKGATYEYKTEEFTSRNFNADKSIGFIAQELKEVFPEAVRTDEDGFYSVNYNLLIPVLVEAIKDQQKQIQKLQSDVANGGHTSQSNNPKLLNNAATTIESSVLEQNKPNPFSVSTEIKSYIAKNALDAAIYVYDMQGVQVKKIQLSGKGEVTTVIEGSELKAGMYLYSLITDGKEIDTKRMILTK